jgi:putative redox protein
MAGETVRADWIEDQVFLLRDRNDFPVMMTQPAGVSGADLLPLSLIGCAAWDVIAILRKQRQQVTGFSVTAESDRDPDPPWRFRRIRIHYRLTGKGIDARLVERAIELSQTKYCAIYATLKEAVEISHDSEVINE